MNTRDLAAVLRLDLAETFRSRWLLLCLAVDLVLGVLFVWIGMRESSLLGFTGMGRVLLSAVHALLLVLPLLALTATVQVVNRARDDGSLELLFSLPIRRGAYFGAISLGRFLVLAVPLIVLFALLAVVARFGFGQAIPWSILARSMLVTLALLVSFVGLGLWLSTVVRSQARAVTWGVVAWMAGIALLDFGLVAMMLTWRLPPLTVFIAAALNPVEQARLALLSSIEPELSVLGPVGFYLANRLGSGLLFALGTVGPALTGLGCWALALRRFTRGDVV